MQLSQANHQTSPPQVQIPRDYNAAWDLLQRNASRPNKVAFIDAVSGLTLEVSVAGTAPIESVQVIRNSGSPRVRKTQVFSNYRRFMTSGRIVQ